MQRGEGDKVGLFFARGGRDGEDCVADLLDVDGFAKGCLLGIVAFEVDAGGKVRNAVRCGGRMVALWETCVSAVCAYLLTTTPDVLPDLLTYELRCTGFILPLAQKQLTQERVQGLLLIAVLLASAGILLLEGRQEPLQHQDGTLLWVGLLGGRDEDGWVLAPVGAELGEGGAR